MFSSFSPVREFAILAATLIVLLGLAPALIGQQKAEQTTQSREQPTPGEDNTTLKWVPPSRPEEIHPILVNFTAALVPLALMSDLLGRFFQRKTLHHAAWWMMLYAAAITPFTVAAGWWWMYTAGPDLPAKLITLHQWLGTAIALVFILLATWRWIIYKDDRPPGAAYLFCAVIAVLSLVYQGSLGGQMVFAK